MSSSYNQHIEIKLCQKQGWRHGFKGGGDNFASGASEKIFLTPPPYDYLGGTEINMYQIMWITINNAADAALVPFSGAFADSSPAPAAPGAA